MWIFSDAPLSPISTGLLAAVDGLLSAMERRRKVYRIPVKVFCMVAEGRPRSMAELGNMQCSPLKEGHKAGSLKRVCWWPSALGPQRCGSRDYCECECVYTYMYVNTLMGRNNRLDICAVVYTYLLGS